MNYEEKKRALNAWRWKQCVAHQCNDICRVDGKYECRYEIDTGTPEEEQSSENVHSL